MRHLEMTLNSKIRYLREVDSSAMIVFVKVRKTEGWRSSERNKKGVKGKLDHASWKSVRIVNDADVRSGVTEDCVVLLSTE
jgi:hypothetical protein